MRYGLVVTPIFVVGITKKKPKKIRSSTNFSKQSISDI